MRFMMLMYPGPKAETGAMPTEEQMAGMMKYNEELSKAGVLLALDGLYPSAQGARVSFKGGKARVIDGPFTEAKELLGGYWMIQVRSREEALEWASRIPGGEDEMVELRRVFDIEDYGVNPDSELGEQMQRVEQSLGGNKS